MAAVTPADAQCAQAALDALVDVLEDAEDGSWLSRAAMLELRGLLAAQMADVRQAGQLEGVALGRRTVAARVHDALEGDAPCLC